MRPKRSTNLLSGLCRISARVTGRGDRLLDLAAVTASCTIRDRHYAGIQTVPIGQIRGSEGRCNDFDTDFHPRQKRGVPLPPVELIRVGEVYFVRDGHHRISVAATLGQQYIDAVVTVWQVDEPVAAAQSRQHDLEQMLHSNALIAEARQTEPDRVGIVQYTLRYARYALSLLATVGFGIARN